MKKTTASPIDKKLAQALVSLDRASQAIEKARIVLIGKPAGSKPAAARKPTAKKAAKPTAKKAAKPTSKKAVKAGSKKPATDAKTSKSSK